MPATAPLEVRRTAAEKRLSDLRAERGAAIVDGQEFDRHDEITAAERDLAGINEAIDEAGRRAASATVKADVAGYKRLQDEYRRAELSRLAALDEAQVAFRPFGEALKKAIAATAAGAAAASDLAHRVNPRGYAGPEADTAPMNFGNRLAGLIRAALRESLGQRFIGPMDLAAQPGDLEPGRPWREGEGKGSHEHFERHAPRDAA